MGKRDKLKGVFSGVFRHTKASASLTPLATPAAAPQTAAPIIPPAASSANSPLPLVGLAQNSISVQGVTVVSALVTAQGPVQPVHQVPSAGAPASSGQALTVVWQRSIQIAQRKLSEKNLPPLSLDDQKSQSANGVIKLTIGDLQSIIQKNSGGVERFGKILKTVEKYAKIVDTAIQHSPEFSSLVWAGVRAIVQVSLNYVEIVETLEAVTDTVVAKMAVCEFYSSVYEETLRIKLSSTQLTDDLRKALDLALPELYAAVLVFSVKARQYLVPSNMMKRLGNMLKPFAVELQPFIQDISEKEVRVRECADMATMERIMKNSKQLEQMHALLSQIESMVVPLKKLDEIAVFASKAEDGRVQKLLEMLSPLESPKRHQDMRVKRYAGTGAWLLQCAQFQLWNDQAQSGPGKHVMCCYGMPGAGKTIISSTVIDHLISQHGESQVAYIYCDYRDQTNQTVVHILGSFLKQLLSTAIYAVPEAIISELEAIQRRGKRVETSDVTQMLKSMVSQLNFCFLCIDALDELEPRVRLELLKLLQSEFSVTRIFLTGRSHIQLEVDRVLQVNWEDSIRITANLGDIEAYLHHEIEVDMEINPDEMNETLKQEILRAILSKANGMFLLPALHISMVLEQPTIAARREALEILPSKLDGAYEQTIGRIQTSSGLTNLGMRVLMWLHLATRPLKLAELQHALAVVLKQGKRGNVDLDKDQIPQSKRLLDCCLGLVTVDEETLTVRFVHYTLEEYFKAHFDTYFPNGHSTAAEVCLAYLNFEELTASSNCLTPGDMRQRMQQWPFLEYAASHWGHYARRQSNPRVVEYFLKLHRKVCGKLPHIALETLFYCIHITKYMSKDIWNGRLLFLDTHAVAYFGLDTYVTALVNDRNWNKRGFDGRTPIAVAASEGHEAIVRLLVEREGVDVNSKDTKDCTPLTWAAKNGHRDVVQLLLGWKDVNVNSKDKYGYTPLACVAQVGYGAIVRLLLERSGVDVNSKDRCDYTPLVWAAKSGHETVVQLLLERADVDVNSKGTDGYTPLILAAKSGHEAVVRLLLERKGVGVNSKDARGSTPLTWAAESGHEAVVRLLLEREDVDVSLKDARGFTPLASAAVKGNDTIVRLLLKREDVDINSKDSYGDTPLACAAMKGHEVVVRLLLERDGVDVNSKDTYGYTTLTWAAKSGHEAVVRLLVERKDVDVNSKDIDGYTPLTWAAIKGYEAVVRLLLGREDVDVNTKDVEFKDYAPLSHAARKGHWAIVELLEARAVQGRGYTSTR